MDIALRDRDYAKLHTALVLKWLRVIGSKGLRVLGFWVLGFWGLGVRVEGYRVRGCRGFTFCGLGF